MKRSNFVTLISIGMALFLGACATGRTQPTPPYSSPGLKSHMATDVKMVADAFEKLGYPTTTHKDSRGNPHLVLDKPPSYTDDIAVYFDDCGLKGCEDITFYASFGSSTKATLESLNEWNHIGTKTRSKAFISKDSQGKPVGLAHTVSFYGPGDAEKIGMSAGLFILEAKLFAYNVLGRK